MKENPISEETKEKLSESAKNRWKDPEERKRASDIRNQYFEDPEAHKKSSDAQKKRYEDPKEHKKQSDINKKRFEDPKSRERHSAALQGQDYDAGEWTGWTNKTRPHLILQVKCIHLNPKFEGCHQHHIMSGVIINIPIDLHRSIIHRIPNGKRKGRNMDIINKLAIQFLKGEI